MHMTYKEAIDYLYNALPAFERNGAGDYKPGLATSYMLSGLMGLPHLRFRSIHIAGTNGKGSTAHTMAAVLQAAGYRTGLYTSPHIVDFSERIRINGEPIPHREVSRFVERHVKRGAGLLCPSFFELTTIMAFDYFARSNVDIAVVETGLGGRLDTTNIISPLLSVITNVSLDHTDLLGDTVAKIAGEKVGIVKRGTPVVLGNGSDADVLGVVAGRARELDAPLLRADNDSTITWHASAPDGTQSYRLWNGVEVEGDLRGAFQFENARTSALALRTLAERCSGFEISPEAYAKGMANVEGLTGLRGRMTRHGYRGRTIVCDTGHNPGAWERLGRELEGAADGGGLHMVVGFVGDKDIAGIIGRFPRNARYYLTGPSTPRGLKAGTLAAMCRAAGMSEEAMSTFPDVVTAFEAALGVSSPGDTIFVGGSNYLLSDFYAVYEL